MMTYIASKTFCFNHLGTPSAAQTVRRVPENTFKKEAREAQS